MSGPESLSDAQSSESSSQGSPPPRPETTISTVLLTRIIIALIAIWSLVAGLVLVIFQGSGSDALGAGVEDVAGHRLLGAHLMFLSPLYALIAWRHERYGGLFWLPFVSQLVAFLVVGYNILIGDTDFGDGMVAVTVSGIFIGLWGFVWITEQRALARMRLDEEEAEMTWLNPEDASVEEPADSPD
jgi:hypothetical protein